MIAGLEKKEDGKKILLIGLGFANLDNFPAEPGNTSMRIDGGFLLEAARDLKCYSSCYPGHGEAPGQDCHFGRVLLEHPLWANTLVEKE